MRPRAGYAVGLAGAVAVLALAIPSCAPVRPQLLVTVTSDLAVPSQLQADPALAAVGTFDRVRVETLRSDGSPDTTRDFVIDAASSFPLSFGVAAPDDPSRELLVRVTAFRSRYAQATGTDVSPLPYARVERLLALVPNGVDNVSVALLGACIGRPADLAKRTSCLDESTPAGPLTPSSAPADLGTFGPLREVPCARTAQADRTCIPGGLGVVGAPELKVAEGDQIAAEPRIVLVSPFSLGKTEVSVAILRRLFDSGLVADKPPTATARAMCNYSDSAGTADNQAARCVSFATARAACRAMGGDLPSATQWEYAARGRGLGRTYPWGETEPSCCVAALAGGALGCKPKMAVGAYTDGEKCSGVADVARDGALDLAGGVREWVLDAPLPLSECVGPGLLKDVACAAEGSLKGGSFTRALPASAAALRFVATTTDDVGFRCAFPD